VFAAACDSGAGEGPGTNPDSGGLAPRPITSAEATVAVNQRVDELIAGLGDSTAQLDMTNSTTAATGNIVPSCPDVTGSTGGSGTADEAPKSATQALDDLMHQIAQEAREHVFRDEFVERQDGNQVIYKVDPASACGTDNPTCVEKLTTNPLRFAVTANTDGSLNVSLLVGLAQHTPATALLGSNRLSLRVDLAEALAAVRLYVDPEDQADLPEHLVGVVEGAIDKRGPGDFAITSTIVEKLDLMVGQAKGKPVAVTVQPSAPTTQLTINSLTNVLGLSANLGAVDVAVAGAAVCDDSCGTQEQTGTFSGHLGGLTGAVSVTRGAQELSVAGLGLGSDTSFVSINDGRLGALDVNAQNGRKVTVTFKQTAEGTLVTFDPALDIKLAMTLNKLSDTLRVDMPEWLNDEIFDVMLGGGAKPSVLIPAATCDAYGNATTKDQLKVASGTLTLKESSLPSPVTVAAGMCLLPVDTTESQPKPLTQVAAGVCR
jgi:hypothetical protein